MKKIRSPPRRAHILCGTARHQRKCDALLCLTSSLWLDWISLAVSRGKENHRCTHISILTKLIYKLHHHRHKILYHPHALYAIISALAYKYAYSEYVYSFSSRPLLPHQQSPCLCSQKQTLREFKGKEFIWKMNSGNSNREVEK